MASLSQPRSPVIHSWRVPAHYFQCKICRDFRRAWSQEAQRVAHEDGCREAQHVGQEYDFDEKYNYRHRVLAISSRLRRLDRPLDPTASHKGLHAVTPARRVTIKVPHLVNPVRPDSSIGLLRKRPLTFTDYTEPAQYLVPEQPDPQAGADFWTAIREAIRLGAPASAPVEPPRTCTLASNAEFSMPGTWPSWADEPNPVPPPVAPHLAAGRGNPVGQPSDQPSHGGNGLFTFFGGLSSIFLGLCQAVRWRTVQPSQPADANTTPTSSTSTVTQTAEGDGSRSPKRPKLFGGLDHQERVMRYGPSRPLSHGRSMYEEASYSSLTNRRSASLGRQDHTGFSRQPRLSASTRRASNEPATPYRTLNKIDRDPNFNYAGHFSVDAIYASDSEDEEYPGSPMDIDPPEPIVSQMTETILARQPIEPGHSRSYSKSDEQTPIALNQTEAILADHSINPINGEPRPRLSPAAAAAQRAVTFFPKGRMTAKGHAPPFVRTEKSTSATLVSERRPHKSIGAPTSLDTPSPRSAEKARYDDVLEFFPNDIIHSLPGLGDECLPADAEKVEHLKRELMERLRQEEIEAQRVVLARLGVRRPKSALIQELSPEWLREALAAPRKGTFDPRPVHPDAVELKPRDFNKLVPPTAWLNDDCVHATLCCLAASINKKANVKPKVDPPKCVAVSSLYWKSFCDDHKKLYPRPFSRKWNMTAENFLNIETVLIPVNLGVHWTLLVIRPSRRTVSYLDSFQQRNERQLGHAYEWLRLFLGDKFVEDDWDTQEFGAPRQTNAYDCGMFVITNAMCLALGLSPMCYNEENMPIQRQRIAAMLLNGGFHGEFDLGHL
ncbi:hypothetical protein F4802DRAFT_613476 [Xylaria palmicola]|nr:hypothetical protein F4802DRAFT_613476 [Xylaria palmicola]